MFEPYITIRKQRIPPVEQDKSFTYLGKDFNFKMNTDEIKDELKSEIRKYVETIDKLPIKCFHKMEIMQHYILSKLKWRFFAYHLTETWVSQNLENVINRYYHKWLHFPVSGNIAHLSLPKNKLGLNIKTLKQIYVKCKVSVLQTLKLSRNEEVRTLYQLTNDKNVNTGCLINSIDIAEKHLFRNKKKSVLSKATKETIWNKFLGLKEQCGIIKFLVNTILTNQLVQWQKVTSSIPSNIVNFVRRYVIYSLSNGTNLQKWKKKQHQTVNFVKIKRLSYIYLITAQAPLNDMNGDTTLSSK